MVFINRHSFLLAGSLAVALAGSLAATEGLSAPWLGLVVLVILALTGLFRWLGAGGSSHGKDQAVVDLIGRGTPVLLLFQSAY